MKGKMAVIDWLLDREGARGRTGRPDTPLSSSSVSSRHNTSSQEEDDEMCHLLASESSDETVSAVPVPVAPERADSPRARLPSSVSFQEGRYQSMGHNPKRNAFAARAARASRASSSSRLQYSSRDAPPPLPPILKKPARSSSEPPSPPKKMDDISKSPTDGGCNKPLPMSPSSEHDPRSPASVPSPASPPAIKEDTIHPLFRVGNPVPPTLRRTSMTTSKTPEVAKDLQQNYDTDIARLGQKLEDLNRLEKKVNGLKEQLESVFRDHTVLSNKHTKLGDNLSSAIFNVERELTEDGLKLRADHDLMRASQLEHNDRITLCVSALHELNDKINQCIAGVHEKIDSTIGSPNDNPLSSFIASQCRKNLDLQNENKLLWSEIGQLKEENRNLTRLLVRVRMGLTLLDPENALSYELVSPDALPPDTSSGRERIVVVPNAPSGTDASSGSGATPSPATSISNLQKQTIIPRRAKQTLTKKMSTSQLAGAPQKNTSGSAIASGSKENPIDKQDSAADATKRRGGLFGSRRRRDEPVSSNTSVKGSQASLPEKEADVASPVLAIPQNAARTQGEEESATEAVKDVVRK